MTNKKSFVYKDQENFFVLPRGTGNVVRTIKKGKFYEQKFLEYIKSLDIAGTYVDIGANIGNHTVYFGKYTNADKVLSFEASEHIYKILIENIRLNGLTKKIIPNNVAVGSKKDLVSLKINERDEVGGGEIINGDDIAQIPLDNYKKENITIIKMDVEGYEYEVLQGMKDILATRKPELFIEAATKSYFNKINKFLDKYGYEMVTVYNNTATYHFSTKEFEKSSKIYKNHFIRRILRNS